MHSTCVNSLANKCGTNTLYRSVYEVLDLMAGSDEFYTSYHSIYGKVVLLLLLLLQYCCCVLLACVSPSRFGCKKTVDLHCVSLISYP